MCIFIIFMLIFPFNAYATDNVMSSQQEELKISSFIKETDKYTKNVVKDFNMDEIFNNALTGKVDNSKILNKVLNIFGKEVKECLGLLRKCVSSYYNT